jgi:hypothetical protein
MNLAPRVRLLAMAVFVGVVVLGATPLGYRDHATTGGKVSSSVERPSYVYPPDGKKWLPLRIPGSHAAKGVNGASAQIVELRGWLTFVGDRCYSENPASVSAAKLNPREPDWHYNLELDPAWLDHLGVHDPNTIVRPGNVINSAARLAEPGDALGHETGPLATASSWGLVARPIVHVEVASWDPSRHKGETAPTGWRVLTLPDCPAGVRWPYDPRNPIRGQAALVAGQYVRMVGSLVTDDPHVRITEEEADYASSNRAVHGILGGDDPTTLAVRLFWEQERSENSPRNGSRWSELHPPDTVDVLSTAPSRDAQILRSVAVATPPDLPAGATYTLNVTLPVPRPSAPSATPHVVEIIGPDTRPRTLRGTTSPPPVNRVTVTPDGVQLHITVARHGRPGTPSAFQATYRISP